MCFNALQVEGGGFQKRQPLQRFLHFKQKGLQHVLPVRHLCSSGPAPRHGARVAPEGSSYQRDAKTNQLPTCPFICLPPSLFFTNILIYSGGGGGCCMQMRQTTQPLVSTKGGSEGHRRSCLRHRSQFKPIKRYSCQAPRFSKLMQILDLCDPPPFPSLLLPSSSEAGFPFSFSFLLLNELP